MTENRNQLEQLIKVELLGVMTRIVEVSIQKGLDEEQEEKFIKLLKNIIDNQITFAWGITKLLNELDKKTPQDVRDQGELIKLCSPIIEFLKQQSHPYHTVLIKEESVELLETKQYIPQTKIQAGNGISEITLMVDGKEMSKSLLNGRFFI